MLEFRLLVLRDLWSKSPFEAWHYSSSPFMIFLPPSGRKKINILKCCIGDIKVGCISFGVVNFTALQQIKHIRSDQIRSVAQSCPTLCDPMDCSTPGLPVHHQLPEFTQTHVHRVSDAIQPSHPLSSPSPLAPNPSQHQSLFQ